jgi:NAD(P)-dependent dehydrogenase (short-subunit alcohol dehydrogenase family)
LSLAAEAAAVVVIARSTAEVNETVALIKRSGGQALGVAMDVTDLHHLPSAQWPRPVRLSDRLTCWSITLVS